MTAPDAARPVTVPVDAGLLDGLEWGPADGPTVLLLHGFPQHCTSWRAVGERLGEAGLRAVAVNQRGYADGARPAEVSAYALAKLVGDAVAAIDALGGAVDLVGHDWGGVVGWQVAARHPERVRTWTALSTPYQPALDEALARDPAQRERLGYMALFRQEGVAEATLLGDDGAALRRMFGSALTPERVAEDVDFVARPGVLTAALSWYRAMSPSDADGLGPVTVPTTYLWGSGDVAFGRDAAELTGAHVHADYRFVPLDGASHWLPDEAADTVADAIAERAQG